MVSVKKLKSSVTKESRSVSGWFTTPVLIAVASTLLLCIGVVWLYQALQRSREQSLSITANKNYSARICSRAVPNQTGFVITQPKPRIIENLTIVGTHRETNDKLTESCLLQVTWDELTNSGRQEKKGEYSLYFVEVDKGFDQISLSAAVVTDPVNNFFVLAEEKNTDPWVVNAVNLLNLVQ